MNIPISYRHIKDMPDRVLVPRIAQMLELETAEFFYGKAAPMFLALHRRYRIGNECVLDLINDFYVALMKRDEESGDRKIDSFAFRSLFITWVARVALNYCLDQLYNKKENVPMEEDLPMEEEEIVSPTDIIDYNDVLRVIESMPNPTYRRVMKMMYVDECGFEEVAAAIGVTVDNLYNIRRRARLQFIQVYNKEMAL